MFKTGQADFMTQNITQVKILFQEKNVTETVKAVLAKDEAVKKTWNGNASVLLSANCGLLKQWLSWGKERQLQKEY